MVNQLIKREEWKEYFDYISKNLLDQEVELETVALETGDQIEEDWSHLDGMTYEPREDILFIYTATTEHPIQKPLEIVATEEGSVIRSIAVKDASGSLQIINFRTPIKLESGAF